jgi:hypothetical protein
MTNFKTILATALLAGFQSATADIHQIPLPMDLPTVVQGSTQFDSSTHLYKYSYTVQNPSSNDRGVWLIMLQLQPGVDVATDINSPSGWSGDYDETKQKLVWGATQVTVPPGHVDTGSELPGDAIIPPGSQLSGFSFKSFSFPGMGLGITQVYAPLPSADDSDELTGLPYESTLPESNGYRLQVPMPIPDSDWSGNRRPAVDNFLAFANVKDKDTYAGSALVVIRLAAAGETVYPSTLKITLNGQDVTGMFQQNSSYKGLAATFTTTNSALKVGTNTLLTAVDGIVPGTADHVATDHDKVSFTFSP